VSLPVSNCSFVKKAYYNVAKFGGERKMNFSAEYQNTGSWCHCLFDRSFPKWEKIGDMAPDIQLRTPTIPNENSYKLTSEISALNVLLSTLRWSEPQLYLRRQNIGQNNPMQR
jgi:hypothetical protein